MKVSENTVEETALSWLEELGYRVKHGPDIAPGEAYSEREDFRDVVPVGRLSESLSRINPGIPEEALEEAVKKLIRADSPDPVVNNRQFHSYLTDGVPVEYYSKTEDRTVHDQVWIADFSDPDNNDWLAVNQFSVVENKNHRRADVVIFLNGLPVAVMELKNPADEYADLWGAYNQLQTYKSEIPSLFQHNEILIISDGTNARIGSLTAPREWFLYWRTIEGEEKAPDTAPQLEVMIRGVFDKKRFLDYIRHFVVFEDDGSRISKKIAGYHQYHAVNRAIETTIKAAGIKGDGRAGVVWHTQGSGKSLTMAFFAGKIIRHPAMGNPTIVALTDRNDLDQQLFDNFCNCKELLRQTPVQAENRPQMRELLNRQSGGVIFTTIQKFFPEDEEKEMPELSGRRNIVVIADEAHRSQYEFKKGFARHVRDALPNASFMGFTGTPLERDDKNTRNVFGDYISIYDIEQSVADESTVPIYYEGRLAKLELDDKEKPKVDPEFEEVTEGEELEKKEKLKTKWARLEKLVGTEKRIKLIAEDIVNHFENRLSIMEGKGMIVCMSRRICVALYDELIKLRPDWHNEDDNKGILKVVMTGSATDPTEWQQHVRNKPRRKYLANRFKDEKDPFKLVIVRDMWLTGFDVPSLHTMYVDKPMKAHGLMQAIARVNRVFRDKPGGVVVDYLGLAHELKKAMRTYTESGGRGETTIDQEKAVAKMQEKVEICRDIFHGFDYSKAITGTKQDFLNLLPAAQDHVLAQEKGKEHFMDAVAALSKAFALAVPHDEALKIRDEVSFFQAVKSGLKKVTPEARKSEEDIDFAIRQIVSRAVASEEVVDIFASVGLSRPDISILSDEFLSEVKTMPQKNLAVEVLNKLLRDEIKSRSRKNLVQSRSFLEMLERTIRSYQNRSIEAAAVIAELIELARQMREADKRGEKLGLSDDELAFYDALEVNDSAVAVLGDETLQAIALELVEKVRNSVTIDWSIRESARAKIRTMVKRILRKHGYPPDKEEKATQTVLEQTELLCDYWVA